MKRANQTLYSILTLLILLKVLAAVENFFKDDLQAFFISGLAGLLVICIAIRLYSFLVKL